MSKEQKFIPPSICPLTYWQGIDSKPNSLRQLFEESKMEVDIINNMGKEEFRGLIVNIYSLKEVAENSPEPKQNDPSVSKPMAQPAEAENSPEPKQNGPSVSKPMAQPAEAETSPEPKQNDPGVSKPMAQPADHELHSITHPTVDEMIYGKGPGDIMEPKVDILGLKLDINAYKRYRWIHIPMNHVSPASRTLIFYG
jgi:hypothetical protein